MKASKQLTGEVDTEVGPLGINKIQKYVGTVYFKSNVPLALRNLTLLQSIITTFVTTRHNVELQEK